MRAPQFVLRTHYSMYRRCPQRWRIATVATDTPPNLLPVQGLYIPPLHGITYIYSNVTTFQAETKTWRVWPDHIFLQSGSRDYLGTNFSLPCAYISLVPIPTSHRVHTVCEIVHTSRTKTIH